MPMQVIDKSGTNFIPTKQKIAERAGAQKASPVVPSAPAPPGVDGLFPEKSKSLANLSFKKKTVSNVATSQVPLASVKKQASAPVFSDREVVRSPVSVTGGWGDTTTWSPVVESPRLPRLAR